MPRSNANVKEGLRAKYWRAYFGVDGKGFPLFLKKKGKNNEELDANTRFYLDVTDFDPLTGNGVRIKPVDTLERTRITVGHIASRDDRLPQLNRALEMLGDPTLSHKRYNDPDQGINTVREYKAAFKQRAEARVADRAARSRSRSRRRSTPRARSGRRSSSPRLRSPSRSPSPARSSTPRARSRQSNTETTIVAESPSGASVSIQESAPPVAAPAKRAAPTKRGATKKAVAKKAPARRRTSSPRSTSSSPRATSSSRSGSPRATSSTTRRSSIEDFEIPRRRARGMTTLDISDLVPDNLDGALI